MTVTVIGKEKFTGKSKKQEMNIMLVHVSFNDKKVEGQKVTSRWLDGEKYPSYVFKPQNLTSWSMTIGGFCLIFINYESLFLPILRKTVKNSKN